MSVRIDERDFEILRMLVQNARISYIEIARSMGLSDVAVIKRIKRLESLGVIKGYTAVVDPKKLGYSLISMTGIDVDPEHLFRVVDKLKSLHYIKFIAITSGDHSIMTIIWARDRDELAKIHDEISNIPGVRRVCPAVILDVVKDERI